MTYFVLAHDGQRYGPIDLNGLNQWAQEGRVGPATVLIDVATNQQMMARDLPGLVLPSPAGPSMPGTGAAYYPRPQTMPPMGNTGDTDMTIAWVCGGLGLLCCPLISIAGIVYGIKASQLGNKAGTAAAIFSGVTLFIGICSSAFVFRTMGL